MKVFISLLLLSFTLFAQYGLVLNTSWAQGSTYTYDVLTTSGISISQAVESTADLGGAVSNGLNLNASLNYAVLYTFTLNSGTKPNFRFVTTANGRSAVKGFNFQPTAGTHKAVWSPTEVDGDDYMEVSVGNAVSTDFALTNVELRQQLDTLFVDGTNGNDADEDTVKTLAEMFTNRGAHSGGTLIILAGTYAESVTVDSNLTKIQFVGTPTFTQIDANSKTFTVDGCYTGTFINDGNVTYINPCATTSKFKGNSTYSKFKGW